MSLTPPPPAPSRSDPPATFITKADTYLAWQATFVAEMEAAIQVANITLWVSGTTYALNALVWSPIDYRTYLRIIAGAGTTDPSADATNWKALPNGDTGIKIPCRVATTGNITTLAGGAPNVADGVTLAANDRVFVNAQSTASQNGIYIVTTLGTGADGTWTRATDADGAGELLSGMLVTVSEGTVNGKSVWMLTTPNPITIGTTGLTFERKDAGAVPDVPMKTVRTSCGGNVANLSGGTPDTTDGVSLAVNDRILVIGQSTASQNGIYVVTVVGTGADGTWVRAADVISSGMLVTVSEGTTNADSLWMLTTDDPITIGTTALTFGRKDAVAFSASVQGAFKNLSASASGTSANVIVSADEVVVENSSNIYQTLRAVSLTIAGTSVGANALDTGTIAASTWYSVWVIWDGTTTAGLLSLSATAPTLPGGYTHKARIGWIRTDGTGNKFPLKFVQKGRKVQYSVAAGSNLTALRIMSSGAQGSTTTPTWVAVATGNFIPSTAGEIDVVLAGQFSSGTAYEGIVAPNNGYGGITSSTKPPPLAINNLGAASATGTATKMSMVPESSNIYAALSPGSGTIEVLCAGWTDNF